MSISFACVMRRILDICPVVLVGMRSASADQVTFIQERDLPFLTPQSYRALTDGPREIARRLSPNVYVSLDLDGLDPSQMAAVGTPEPGGLGWYEVLDILRTLFAQRKVVGMDLVELAPIGGSHVSEFTAARLAAKMLSYLGA